MGVQGKKYVITGGASLIGSHIAERLLECGAAGVTLFDNLSLGSAASISPLLKDGRARLIRGDILRPNDLYEAFEAADGVFAVAALLTMPLGENPSLGVDVNVSGMMNVLDACRYRGVRKVVYSSSIAVYGQDERPGYTEDRPFAWQGLQPASALYAATKTVAEILLRLYRQKYGINFMALRYSTVYGERQHGHGINVLYLTDAYRALRRGAAPVLPDDGEEAHDYVYAGDVARANVLAMESDASGESLNIVSGRDVSLNEAVATLQSILGTDVRPEYRRDPSKPRFTTSHALGYSREKARALLGWEPEVGIEEGLRRLIAWIERDGTRGNS